MSSEQAAEHGFGHSLQIPRVELQEMGPSMNLSLRRLRSAGADMEHEAFAKAKPIKKKVRSQLLCLYFPNLQACLSVFILVPSC